MVRVMGSVVFTVAPAGSAGEVASEAAPVEAAEEAAAELEEPLPQPASRRIDALRILDELVQGPFLRIELFVGVLIHLRLDNAANHGQDMLPEIFALQHLPALGNIYCF